MLHVHMNSLISVIIPVFHEAHIIHQTVAHLHHLNSETITEIIVVDGSPEYDTLNVLPCTGAKKISSSKGRGVQMNAGAAQAKGDILLFLHADTILPEKGPEQIARVMGQQHIAGGAFDLEIASERRIFRIIEKTASLRSRITRIPYGDQAIFMRKKSFSDIGGFREIPIMEDADLMRRVKKSGQRIAILSEKALTSARRWEKEGICYGTLRNWVLITLFGAGIRPEILARFYR